MRLDGGDAMRHAQTQDPEIRAAMPTGGVRKIHKVTTASEALECCASKRGCMEQSDENKQL